MELVNLFTIGQQTLSNEEAGLIAILLGFIPLIFGCGFTLIIIAGMWKTFEKADKPGWAAIVPIYNVIVMLEIVGRPLWWIILFLIPLANLVVSIIVFNDLAKAFGRGIGTALGLLFLGFIFWPVLGFGSAQYQGPVASQD